MHLKPDFIQASVPAKGLRPCRLRRTGGQIRCVLQKVVFLLTQWPACSSSPLCSSDLAWPPLSQPPKQPPQTGERVKLELSGLERMEGEAHRQQKVNIQGSLSFLPATANLPFP